MIIALYIFGLLVLTLFVAKTNSPIQFSKEVKELFTESKGISYKTFQQQLYYNELAQTKHTGSF